MHYSFKVSSLFCYALLNSLPLFINILKQFLSIELQLLNKVQTISGIIGVLANFQA
jgi:hypothetical protein